MAFPNFTGDYIANTFQRIVQYASGAFYDGTGSLIPTSILGQGITSYYLNDTVPDIAGYDSLHDINNYVTSSLASESLAADNTEQLIKSFITDPGYPGVTFIPAGTCALYYDSQKTSGAAATVYYTYYKLYVRNTASVETLIYTSDESTHDNSTSLKVNFVLGTILPPGININSSDRLVLKVYGRTESNTCTITIYYDGNTGTRFALPANLPNVYSTWRVGGNSFGGNTTQSIGTLTDDAFVIKTNNVERIKFFALTGGKAHLYFAQHLLHVYHTNPNSNKALL